MGFKEFASLRGLSRKEFARSIGMSKERMKKKIAEKVEVTVEDLQRIWAVQGPLIREEIHALLETALCEEE